RRPGRRDRAAPARAVAEPEAGGLTQSYTSEAMAIAPTAKEPTTAGPAPAKTPLPADQISYEDLYARWEQGNWSAMEIDFSTDRQQWDEDFTDIERRATLWTYSM